MCIAEFKAIQNVQYTCTHLTLVNEFEIKWIAISYIDFCSCVPFIPTLQARNLVYVPIPTYVAEYPPLYVINGT